ncbi:MAG: tRNA (guanosine(46)-N7)-methyltransferase TrmB [Pseudomonadota bacterium]
MFAEKPLRSFGRRKGRNLRPTKQGLFDTLLPSLQISLPESRISNPESRTWLEIGFGGGEHLAHMASLHPEVQFIGCEPYVNGIAGLLAHIDKNKLSNIRIYSDDARDLVAALPDNSLERVFILYPDPWPKTRHHKRRIVSSEFLSELARVMKPGAELRLATDSADYATWMLERLLANKNFKWLAKTCDDWLNPPAEWISTRYEQKALAGIPTYLNFVRTIRKTVY